MLVAAVRADRFRSLQDAGLELGDGITAIVGPNGSGKTNLLEALYFGLTGRSFRTSDRRDLIPFGQQVARTVVEVEEPSGLRHQFMAAVSRTEGGRFQMDGAAIERAEAREHSPLLAVFSPDRLDLVKGPPAVRRSHLDAFVGARWPARDGLRRRYGQALAQRNALLRRIASGLASAADLPAWDTSLTGAAVELIAARTEACTLLEGRYADAAAELGVPGRSGLSYRACSEAEPAAFADGLAQRREADLKAGRTTWGPHLDELRLELEGRQLRRFGSQGQQRTGLLALLFAEREALLEGGSKLPMMLLDDVMSELDEPHRRLLVGRLESGGQSVITAAESGLVPAAESVSSIAIEQVAAGGGGDGEA